MEIIYKKKGIFKTTSGGDKASLFSEENGATVKNIVFENVVLKSMSSFAGTIFGTCNNCNITNII